MEREGAEREGGGKKKVRGAEGGGSCRVGNKQQHLIITPKCGGVFDRPARAL